MYITCIIIIIIIIVIIIIIIIIFEMIVKYAKSFKFYITELFTYICVCCVCVCVYSYCMLKNMLIIEELYLSHCL